MAAVSAFSCWRLAKHAEDETVALFHKFCDVLEKTSVKSTTDQEQN